MQCFGNSAVPWSNMNFIDYITMMMLLFPPQMCCFFLKEDVKPARKAQVNRLLAYISDDGNLIFLNFIA